MNLKRLAVPAIVFFLGLSGMATARANGVTPGTAPGWSQDYGWDAPPRELNDVQRRGFHDGVEGAQKDFGNHRIPDVDNREEYRRPNMPPEMWGPYREGFRRGYDVAMSHLAGGQDWRYRAEQRPWDAPPMELNDMQRRGFHDGVEAARTDIDYNRRRNFDDRDEYRRPNVAPQFQDAYRDGFRRGYQMAMSHLGNAMPVPPPPPVMAWDAPPQELNEIQRQGFQDGIIGAQKDFGNHRRPDVNNRDEYRDPHLPPEQREAYREGFRRGYQRAMSHLMGDPNFR